MSLIRQRWLISGRVQGVFFRQSTAQRAVEIGELLGWVRNLPDGRVEVLVEGDAARVSQLRQFCEQGPPLARVDRLALVAAETAEALAAFTVCS
ncbi:MAG: acylphosphatase [Candidatus Sericytochromatia bacterium]|nr:acylphosphatase [Candidatus Sericytochromatia bacterium]